MAEIEGVAAELGSIIETADLIARDGLQPGSDCFRVLAGLVSQLATQTARMVDAGLGAESQSDGRAQAPSQRDAPAEEDISPEDAPAEPSRNI
jgi:hypothetical protein